MAIEHHPFSDARSFLEAIRGSNSLWSKEAPRDAWIFRGQADADWKLLPKVWRQDAPLKNPWWLEAQTQAQPHARNWTPGRHDEIKYGRMLEIGTAFLAEVAGVESFVELANDIGLRVEECPYPQPRTLKHHPLIELCEGCIPNEMTALAQHHGIPTRLLDWTRRPLVAAFFAANFAADRMREDPTLRAMKHISVWAARTKDLGEFSRVKILTFVSHRNDFLRAQGGVFAYDKHYQGQFIAINQRTCLSAAMNESTHDAPGIPVRKLTLPYEHVADLLELLLREGVSRAHLMPTYDNVADTVMQTQYRDSLPKVKVPAS